MKPSAHRPPSPRVHPPGAARRPQQGAALIVTVLLMMVISLLALAAMMRNNLDERMAFNQRDRQLALQAAEAALREGEDAVVARFGDELDESFFIGMNDCTRAQGWCFTRPNVQGWSSLPAAAWTNGNTTFALNTRTAIAGVSAQPRYLIEYKGITGSFTPGQSCVANFLITARAVGVNPNSTVTLQSLFHRRFGSCQTLLGGIS